MADGPILKTIKYDISTTVLTDMKQKNENYYLLFT